MLVDPIRDRRPHHRVGLLDRFRPCEQHTTEVSSREPSEASEADYDSLDLSQLGIIMEVTREPELEQRIRIRAPPPVAEKGERGEGTARPADGSTKTPRQANASGLAQSCNRQPN